MEPPALIQDTPFRSNTQLHEKLTPYLEQHMVFNLTPKYSFVDLHVGTYLRLGTYCCTHSRTEPDYGMDGISSPIHECMIWFLYPGTELNPSLTQNELGQHAKFARLGGLLEGGMVVRTTCRDALYIPAGCVHEVFTIRGGFLVTIDYTTRDSIWSFSQHLKSDLITTLEAECQRHCMFLYLECLAIALEYGGS